LINKFNVLQQGPCGALVAWGGGSAASHPGELDNFLKSAVPI